MQSIDILKNLPDISFYSENPETLLANMISEFETAYEQQTGEAITLYPADKIRIFLYTQALKLYQASLLIDLSAKQNFLKYATDSYLDNISATRIGPERNTAQKALVAVRFTLSAVQSLPVNITQGTRVTAGDNVFFEVVEVTQITAGLSYKDIVCRCTETGLIGNGYETGQINTLVDPIPFVASVLNTELSQGGADIQDNESYRESIWLSPEGFAVAGPENAYIYRAKEYSQALLDVSVFAPEEEIELEYTVGASTYTAVIDQLTGDITGTSITSGTINLENGVMNVVFESPASEITATIPGGGKVDVYPILQNGEIPEGAFLEGLQNYLDDKDKRPLTDKVTVKAPEIVDYSIELTYYIKSSNSSVASIIQNAVDNAVEDYVLWQKSKIGRDINPDELIFKIKNAGAKRVELISPIYTSLEKYEVAGLSTAISVTYGGLESE